MSKNTIIDFLKTKKIYGTIKGNTNKIEVTTESSVILHEEIIEDTKTDTVSSLSLRDLIDYEKAASLICRRYENNIKMYDGSIRQSGLEYENFKRLNDTHTKILNEIEKRVKNLFNEYEFKVRFS